MRWPGHLSGYAYVQRYVYVQTNNDMRRATDMSGHGIVRGHIDLPRDRDMRWSINMYGIGHLSR